MAHRRFRSTNRWIVSPLLLSTFVAALSWAAPRPGHNVFPLEVANDDRCPVRILERRSRVAGALDKDPWAAIRGSGDATPGDREWGPGEYQLVFDVAFQNIAEQEIVAVAFLWQAFDEEGQRIYERISVFEDRPLEPQAARMKHEVALDPARGTGRYRISVLKVQFANGTQWVPPAANDTEEETP